MLKLKEITVKVGTSKNFNSTELIVSVDVSEEKNPNLEKISKDLNAKLRKIVDEMSEENLKLWDKRKQERIENEEKIKLSKKLPETRAEAEQVEVDGELLGNLGSMKIRNLLDNYSNDTREGRAIRIMLGETTQTNVGFNKPQNENVGGTDADEARFNFLMNVEDGWFKDFKDSKFKNINQSKLSWLYRDIKSPRVAKKWKDLIDEVFTLADRLGKTLPWKTK